MLYKAQIKMWATEQALMTWRTTKPDQMPDATALAEIDRVAEVLAATSYHLNQDWQDLRNIMAKMAENPELELIYLEEFKDYLAMVFEQRDAKENRVVRAVAGKFKKDVN